MKIITDVLEKHNRDYWIEQFTGLGYVSEDFFHYDRQPKLLTLASPSVLLTILRKLLSILRLLHEVPLSK